MINSSMRKHTLYTKLFGMDKVLQFGLHLRNEIMRANMLIHVCDSGQVDGDCRVYRALSVWLVEQHVKRRLLILKSFAICLICHAHMTKDTRLSLHFCTASNEKLGRAWERG